MNPVYQTLCHNITDSQSVCYSCSANSVLRSATRFPAASTIILFLLFPYIGGLSDQIVMLGPKHKKTGQYEYIVLSNWAKYPLIAMARNYDDFNIKYREAFVERFKNEGYIHDFSE